MQNFIKYAMGILLMTAPTIIVPEGVEAQLGKIHRKYAQVTVSPEVVTQGDTFFVTVHPWLELEEWKLVVLDGGEEIASKSFAFTQVSQHSFELPSDSEGVKTIQLMGKENGQWRILLEERVEYLPGFYEEVQHIYNELNRMEMLKSLKVFPAWIHNTMANVEDLLERMKKAESGNGWGLRNRLNSIKQMVEDLKDGQDPYEGKTGYQLRGFRSLINGEIQLYSCYLPNGFDPTKKYPTVMMLHGAWSNHHLALRRVMGKTNNRGENDAAAKQSMPQLPDVPFIVIAPNGGETMGYHGVAEEDVKLIPTFFRGAFRTSDGSLADPIDENRLYLTGLSMGGGGTGKFGITDPDKYAAIAPVCGYFDINFRNGTDGLPEFVKRLVELKSPINMVENLKHVPVKLMHGEIDGVVSVKQSQDLHEKLRELDYHSELEVYPGVGHDAWTPAYEDARIFDWFSQFERNPFPKQVRFKTGELHGSAYWIAIRMAKKARAFSSVDASIEEGEIQIKTGNVESMILSLQQELVDMKKEIKISIDGKSEFVITPQDMKTENSEKAMVFISLDGKDWKIKQWEPLNDDNKGYPYPNLNGLYASTLHRHSYVFGTLGNKEESSQFSNLAQEKAFWGDMTDVKWDVVPEDKVDFNSNKVGNVFLFSKVNASGYIQNNIQSLPIVIKGEQIHFGDRVVEKDQGFIFVYPMHGNSWYTTICTATTMKGMKALEKFAKERYSFLGNTYGDFVCMDQEGNPIWGGLFDKNWKIETIEDYQ